MSGEVDMKNMHKAIGINKFGGPEQLQCYDLQKPKEVKGHDLLVNIKAFAINPFDIGIRTNFGRPEEEIKNIPLILGWDAAGVVEQVGDQCKKFKKGDEVFFMGALKNRPGTYSEYILVDERLCGKKPEKLSMVEAAGLPLTSLTAWETLIDRFKISENKSENQNKSLLIINGAGGLGSIALQIAKKYCGIGTVIVTAGKQESIFWCKNLGTDHVINHGEDLESQLKSIKGCENGVDYCFVCYDMSSYFDKIPSLMKPMGACCFCTHPKKEHSLAPYLDKGLNICMQSVFTRPDFNYEIDRHGNYLDKISELCDKKVLLPTTNEVFKAPNDIQKAHKLLAEGHVIGKICLEW